MIRFQQLVNVESFHYSLRLAVKSEIMLKPPRADKFNNRRTGSCGSPISVITFENVTVIARPGLETLYLPIFIASLRYTMN